MSGKKIGIDQISSALVDIGSIVYTTSNTAPDSTYLRADGTAVNGDIYTALNARVANTSLLRPGANTAIIDRFASVSAPAGTTYSADSAIDAGRGAAAAFDGLNADAFYCWHTTNHAPPYWIRVIFTTGQRLNYWDWQRRPDNAHYPTAWTLRGSNDGGSTWTTIYTKTGDGGQTSGNWNINTFPNNANSYTTYEMNITATSTNQYCIIGEIRCGYISSTNTINLPNFTSVTPTGMFAWVRVQ